MTHQGNGSAVLKLKREQCWPLGASKSKGRILRLSHAPCQVVGSLARARSLTPPSANQAVSDLPDDFRDRQAHRLDAAHVGMHIGLRGTGLLAIGIDYRSIDVFQDRLTRTPN